MKPMCSSVDQMHAFAGHKHEHNMMPDFRNQTSQQVATVGAKHLHPVLEMSSECLSDAAIR